MLDLSSLEKAVSAFEKLVEKSQDQAFMNTLDTVAQDGIRAGVVQHFEFTFELSWKMMQRWLRENQTPVDVDFPRTRKDLFRYAAKAGLIQDPTAWFAFAEARNLTVHTYDKSVADDVYQKATQFACEARALLQQLEGRNES